MLGSMSPDAHDRMRRLLSRCIVLTTSYSGCVFFEVCLARIYSLLGIAPDALHVYAACDSDPRCQRVLLAHEGPSAPSHVQKDLCERWGRGVQCKLLQIQAAFAQQVSALERHGGRTYRAAVAEIGTAMLDAMDAVMEKATIRRFVKCAKCGRRCPRTPDAPPHSVTMNAAGSICVEFSSRGKGAALTGKTAIVWICWVWERKLEQEDFIFHECTTRHPTKLLMQRYLGTSHIIFVFVICPRDLGLPCTRKRRMALAISRKFVMRRQRVPESPMAMFGSPLLCDARVFFAFQMSMCRPS